MPNHDDHGRNHAFLYDRATARWQLAPAFDLTYSPGVISRGLTIAGEVSPDAKTVESFLASATLDRATVLELCDQVLAAIADWSKFAARAGVSEAKREEVAATHRQVLQRSGRP